MSLGETAILTMSGYVFLYYLLSWWVRTYADADAYLGIMVMVIGMICLPHRLLSEIHIWMDIKIKTAI